MRLLATWIWQLGVRRFGAGLLKWRSRKVMYLGFTQLVYPWVGVWRSFRFGVDTARTIYLPEMPPVSDRLVNERLSDRLSDRAPVTSAAQLAAEASDAVEHR